MMTIPTITNRIQPASIMKTAFMRLGLPLALMVSTQVLHAQEQGRTPIDRSKQPAPDPAPKASFPKYEEFTLSNGLKVFLVHDERPVVTLRMLVRGGNDRDGDIAELADAVASGLTDGTAKRTQSQFAEQLDFVGATLNASAGPDYIAVTASGLSEQMPTILDLFADAIKNPVFPNEQLDKYKEEQLTGLKANQAEPNWLATNAINRFVYGDTPLGAVTSEESINKLTPEMLRSMHRSLFVPGNATLAVVGNMSKEQLKNTLEGAFKDWKKGATPAPAKLKLPENQGRRIIVVDRPASVQSSIRVVGHGPRLNEPDFPKATIMNSILGAGTGLGNRLAMNLRETHSYTYTPYSYFDANSYRGVFQAAADVRNAVTDSALQQTLYEINRMQTEPVGADELNRNVQSAVGEFLMSIADPQRTARRVQSIDFYGMPKDYYDRLVPAYLSTSSKDVTSLAKKYLKQDDLSVIVVGKASEIKPKLEKFGKVEVWNTEMRPEGAADASVDIGMRVDEVLGRMVDAMGGKTKLQAVTSIKSNAKLTGSFGPQKFEGSLKKVEQAPNKQYTAVDLGVIRQEVFNNGSDVVRVASGQPAQKLEGDELQKELEDSHILQEAYFQEMGATTRILGKKQKNGHETIALEVTLPKGGPSTYYLDAQTFLPYVKENAEGQTVTFEDWKEMAGGVKFPTTVTIEPQPGLKMVASNISYEINTPVDASTFVKK